MSYIVCIWNKTFNFSSETFIHSNVFGCISYFDPNRKKTKTTINTLLQCESNALSLSNLVWKMISSSFWHCVCISYITRYSLILIINGICIGNIVRLLFSLRRIYTQCWVRSSHSVNRLFRYQTHSLRLVWFEWNSNYFNSLKTNRMSDAFIMNRITNVYCTNVSSC